MKKIVFFADAIGAAYNCIAIAQECLRYDFCSYFIADHSFKGFFMKYGFEECLVNLHNSHPSNNPAHQWISHVNSHLSGQHSSFDQIESYVVPLFDKIISSIIHSHEEIRGVVERIKPDVICIDDIVSTPALTRTRHPWVRIVSCNEAEIPDPTIPPKFSGYGFQNKKDWNVFEKHLNKCLLPIHDRLNKLLVRANFPKLPASCFFETSPYLNLLIFPESISYERQNALDPVQFHYLNGCIRKEVSFQLPNFGEYEKYPLIYISHGSMGSGDVSFMQSQINALAYQNCRVLINVGNNLEIYNNLPPNVIASQFFPQPLVIQQADLVIYHGGNNTFNEVLYYGKPSIVIPYAVDQHDNAKRIETLKLGIKIERFGPEIPSIWNIAQGVLENIHLKDKLQEISHLMQTDPGVTKAGRLLQKMLLNS